ncbi:MAG: SRPBCC domain-containing protein [Acidobacteria bacterium]|jgi:hypothetical protein|nr:SRPBCC domain-containing protein [Acidobacteriota bacterium]
MKKLHFSIEIEAPKEKVWHTMLDQESFKVWSAEFMQGSYYEGAWEEGEKIKFLDPEGNGMSSIIAEHRPYEFTSIKHLGIIKDGIEDMESPESKKWVPAYENYTFRQRDGVTEVSVDMDVLEDFAKMMEDMWPKALVKLKTICEQGGMK